MPSVNAPLGLGALFRTYVDALQCEHAIPELRDYYTLKLKLLSHAMTGGVELTAPETWPKPEPFPEWNSIARLAVSTLHRASQYLTPLPIRLEGPPATFELNLDERYRLQLGAKIRELFAIYEALFMDAVRFLFPGVEENGVTLQDLVETGLPEDEPDPTDFM